MSKDCNSCKGTGIRVSPAFTTLEGKAYPERRSTCHACNGSGKFEIPDEAAIRAALKGRKGLRSARPKDPRAYYVWRMARFHGGVDMTMPVMAGVEVHGDPYTPELDALADMIAREYFGSDLRAAYRWGKALGYLG